MRGQQQAGPVQLGRGEPQPSLDKQIERRRTGAQQGDAQPLGEQPRRGERLGAGQQNSGGPGVGTSA